MGRKKPGPKARLKNPRPVEFWGTDEDSGKEVLIDTTDEVSASLLDDAEQMLRKYFKMRGKELLRRPSEPLEDAVRRITGIVVGRVPGQAPRQRHNPEGGALFQTGAAWWSGYVRDGFQLSRPSRPWGRGGRRRWVGQRPPRKAEDKCYWLDTSATPALLKQYDRRSRSWHSLFEVDQSIAGNNANGLRFLESMSQRTILRVLWPEPGRALPPYVKAMLEGAMGRAGKSGRPAYLACATLATLLDLSPEQPVTPEKIFDRLASYRRR